MERSIAEQQIPSIWSRQGRAVDRLARRLFLNRLMKLETGFLTLVDGNERFAFGHTGASEDLRVTITYPIRGFTAASFSGGVSGPGKPT